MKTSDPLLHNDLELAKILELIRTITIMGKKKLYNRLKLYDTNSSDLSAHINTLQSIHGDPDYMMRANQMLIKVASHEADSFEWMDHKCSDDIIFDNWFLNNRFLLTLTNKLKMSSVLIVWGIYLLIYLWMKYYGLPISINNYIGSMIESQRFYIHLFYQYTVSWLCGPYPIGIMTALTLYTYIFYQLYILYQGFVGCYVHYNKCNTFYNKYQSIITVIDEVSAFIETDKYLRKDDIVASVNRLKEIYCSATIGYCAVTRINLQDHLDDLNKMANYVGRIDMMTSLAFAAKDRFIFPKLIENKYPVVIGTRISTPLLKNCQTFDIKFDGLDPCLMLLSGPNKSGKSTMMRTLTLALYLAQSIGITCAEQFKFTPFKYITLYQNIPDVPGRESLFEAEIRRVVQLISRMEQLDGFSFGCVDELFTGTNPEEGMSGTYAVCQKILNSPTSINVVSTHYNQILSMFNKESLKDVQLKYFNATYDRIARKISVDYKLRDGVYSGNMAIMMLEENGFDPEIIDDAQKILKQLKKVN